MSNATGGSTHITVLCTSDLPNSMTTSTAADWLTYYQNGVHNNHYACLSVCMYVCKYVCMQLGSLYWQDRVCDLDGGGWTMVWKHSYMEVLPLTTAMYYFSQHYRECSDMEAGWCNIPNKGHLQPTHMMIVAYHNKNVVWAYKGWFNWNIDHDYVILLLHLLTAVGETAVHSLGAHK